MGREAVATNGAGSRARPHAVVIPFPLQGHVIPAVHLALRLAERGFAVTFVNTESVHHQTTRALGVHPVGYDIFAGALASSSSSSEDQELDVRYELISDGFPLGFDRSLNHDQYMEGVLHVLPAHVEELLRRVVADPATTCLVVDTFFVWPATLARKLGVPYVSFWTEPALIFSLYYHMDLLTKHGHFKCEEPRKDTITYIPGVPAIEPCELMSYLQETDTTSVVHRIIFKSFEEARGADYILCNTVEELEPSTIAALRAEKPFYAVGPIFPAGFARSAVATSMWAESDCSRWLDAQPAGSVLYISFGSYAHVTKQELHEIAGGVLASGARFLWVLRPDIVSSDDPDPLPEGFLAAAAGRGIVVQWCCQVEVLTHAAVGGFLTHCGWNSILESVWAGVPMLCFPLLTDQLTNRRLVAREWGAGVSVGDRGAVRADEVRARIEGVMGGEEGVKLREQVRKLRGTLEAAVAPGGSSRRNFDEFVDELKRRCGGH
ncbi:UDP-glycosyltransferase 86A1-like isoform X3 [Phragmites australis]|uniref:UDP-glycosyltransferase 86A1-like isoform X3 n=1 Tax=Phragmites australis TaxID=29695 RepID=UPI002D774212|nr:UDP-glycosyltransferase 86A1-like isoform X3 [Phragmites australis]